MDADGIMSQPRGTPRLFKDIGRTLSQTVSRNLSRGSRYKWLIPTVSTTSKKKYSNDRTHID